MAEARAGGQARARQVMCGVWPAVAHPQASETACHRFFSRWAQPVTSVLASKRSRPVRFSAAWNGPSLTLPPSALLLVSVKNRSFKRLDNGPQARTRVDVSSCCVWVSVRCDEPPPLASLDTPRALPK